MTLRLSDLPSVASRERIKGDPLRHGLEYGVAVHQRYPSLSPIRLAEELGALVCERSRGGRTIPRVWSVVGGSLFYSRKERRFLIEVDSGLDDADRSRIVAVLLGALLIVSYNRVFLVDYEKSFARGFADGFLNSVRVGGVSMAGGEHYVRSLVRDTLFGDGELVRRAKRDDDMCSITFDGVSSLVSGSAGSGKLVADGCVEVSGIGSGESMTVVGSVASLLPTPSPDSVVSLNGRTVEVYNRDGVPLSTVVDGRCVSIVNERTGESVKVPEGVSHVFFVGGYVRFHYLDWGEPDLVFDDGWELRQRVHMCRYCGAGAVIDGDTCYSCGYKLPQGWLRYY